jgi:hypothetical protein
MIPRDVLLECARELSMREAADLVERRIIHAGNAAEQAAVDRLLDRVCEPDALRLHSVVRWRTYLTSLHYRFYGIWDHLRHASRERLPLEFRGGSGGEAYVSTNCFAALPIAASIYHLDSWNIQGDVIECGCFKGVSSAMLSWACKLLGRRLWVADSFNGLPAVTNPDEQWYGTGDYAGSLDEVRRTIRTFGCEDVVGFIPGYFEESLPFVRERFALIWADVDLKLSMDSVLQWLMPRLHDDGAFFSDEVSAQCFAGPDLDARAVSVAQAIREYFNAQGVSVPGRNLHHSVSAFAPGATGELFLSFDRLQRLLLHETGARAAATAA